MIRALGDFDGGLGFVEMSFREPERWASMSTANKASRVAGVALHSSGILIGDDESGPAFLLLALGPAVRPPDAPAHSHASDSWRMSLLGTLPVGNDEYGPGDFTFRQGWKPYAKDNYANGEEGGWSALMFADRRGIRVRHVKHDGPAIGPMDQMLASWLGVEGDLVHEDGADALGDSSMHTTLDGVARTGARVNGSFHDTTHWSQHDGVSLAIGAVGDKSSGPLVIMTKVAPGRAAFGSCTIDTDVVRLVVDGEVEIGTRQYQRGDLRVQEAGVPFEGARSGASGLHEVVVLADRRALNPSIIDDDGWSRTIDLALSELAVHARRPAMRVRTGS